MKKFLLLILFCFFISCAADQAQFRETTKNNYLELGSYSLGIDKRFEFIGSLDGEFKADNIDDASGELSEISGTLSNIERSMP